MFTIGKTYHLGRKTFWFFFFTRAKSFIALLLLALVVTYLVYAGSLRQLLETTLLVKYSYITIDMILLWLILIDISILMIALLRASVLYRQYDFTFYEHALHIKHGIFLKKEHILPYQQIQNVEIHRSYTYAIFGLVELDIITGLTEREVGTVNGKKINLFPAVDRKLARSIAHELMKLAAERNGYVAEVRTEATSQKNRRRRR
ncbi:MAG: Bacterial domain [Candidatus Parcubacteria bacterium]|jgi:membrane protein YdbS with pleckstrin-like domain